MLTLSALQQFAAQHPVQLFVNILAIVAWVLSHHGGEKKK